ncbi:MAG: hypothetical protein ACRD3E_15800, partial [Terriglobales bacterium]
MRRTLKAFADAVEYADALDNRSASSIAAVVPEPTPPLDTPPARARDPRPHVSAGRDIDDYVPSELQSL